MIQRILPVLLLWASAQVLYGQNFSNGFNFSLPYFDSTAQSFLPAFPAYTIGAAHRVAAAANGSFQLPNGKPIRFWGVNIVAAACFPPKNKAAAIAARMRKMGINLVRFHHLENNWSGDDGCIFRYAQGTRQLNATTHDRLEYFIAQLKRNGIYVNMNLNVSRVFKEADGVRGADSLPEFAKAVTLFDPFLQQLQREYAQQVLTHVNPYTGLPLGQDPVLAMVEMNNENTLYGSWKDNALRFQAQGGWLINRHHRMLDSLWQVFLTNKYGTQANLATAWNAGLVAPGQGELLQNGGFETGNAFAAPWYLEQHAGAQATASVSTQSPFAGNACGRLQVNNATGTEWHIQFKNAGFSLKKDSVYVLKFAGRALSPTTLSVSVMRDNDPYNWYGGMSVHLTTQWQTFTLSFTAPENNSGAGRVTINAGDKSGTFFFDAFSLGPPSISGVLPGENLASKNIKRILHSERLLFSNRRVADLAAFYHALEKNHFDALRGYLKQDLQVSAPITGTNALTGPSGAYTNSDMDYLDDHSYWDHPWFTQGSWDPYYWLIGNTSLLRSQYLDAVSNITAGLQLRDKPYTISEYNHAAPNRFRTEMVPALLAYSAFHGVDGIMWFDYNSSINWEADFMDGFFSVHRDNSIMAMFPACAYAYREGMIAEDNNPLLVSYSTDWLQLSAKKDNEGRWGKYYPYSRGLALTHSLRVADYAAAQTSDFTQLPPIATGNLFTTQTGETAFDATKGVLATATPRYCALSGFLGQNPNVQAGDLRLLQANEFGAITWVALGEAPLQQASRSLLTISTKLQNNGMVWDGLQSVHNNWGTAPTQIAPMSAALRLQIQADSIRVYPLDVRGKEGAGKTYYPGSSGNFDIALNQAQQKTLWWGIQAFGSGITGTTLPQDATLPVRLYPNPATNGPLTLEYTLPTAARAVVRVYDALGRLQLTQEAEQSSGRQFTALDVSRLPKGVYAYSLELVGKGQVSGGSFVVAGRP